MSVLDQELRVGASRSVQERPGASRSVHERPGAPRSTQERLRDYQEQSGACTLQINEFVKVDPLVLPHPSDAFSHKYAAEAPAGASTPSTVKPGASTPSPFRAGLVAMDPRAMLDGVWRCVVDHRQAVGSPPPPPRWPPAPVAGVEFPARRLRPDAALPGLLGQEYVEFQALLDAEFQASPASARAATAAITRSSQTEARAARTETRTSRRVSTQTRSASESMRARSAPP